MHADEAAVKGAGAGAHKTLAIPRPDTRDRLMLIVHFRVFCGSDPVRELIGQTEEPKLGLNNFRPSLKDCFCSEDHD